MNEMPTRDTLMAFSEWLERRTFDDGKTHQDIADEFISDWESSDRRALLCGRSSASATQRQVVKRLDSIVDLLHEQTRGLRASNKVRSRAAART